MLWEMLAGRRMWHGMTEVEIVAHLASNQPLPPLPSDGSVPADLEAICARALDLDPDRRYQTAADLELALEGVLAGAADSHTRNLGKVMSLAFDVELSDRQAFIERCVGQRTSATRAALTTTLEAELPDIDVTLSGLEANAAPRPLLTLPRGPWLRGAAAVAALAAVALVIALVDGGRTTGRYPSVSVPSRSATPPSRGVPELAGRRPSPSFADGASRPSEPPRPRRRHRAPVLDEDATLPLSATASAIVDPDDDPRH